MDYQVFTNPFLPVLLLQNLKFPSLGTVLGSKAKKFRIRVPTVDILSSLQRLDLEDLRSMISPNRELDPEFEQSIGNEVSTVALMSRKLSKALGLEDMSLP
jgi:hypothetical protein